MGATWTGPSRRTLTYFTKVHGGKYETFVFFYGGTSSKCRYDQSAESDAHQDFCSSYASPPTDMHQQATRNH